MENENIVLDAGGASFVEGIPEYFLKDDDFVKLISDKEYAHQIYGLLCAKTGKKQFCVGRLGKEENGVYHEKKFVCGTFKEDKVDRGLGFYAKVK